MKWNNDEIDFLLENILLSPKEAHLLFIQTFGNSRSQESIRKQMKRLRDTIVAENDAEGCLDIS
jgi:hypothetical protein